MTHDFKAALEAFDAAKRQGELVYICEHYETIQTALRIADRLQSGGDGTIEDPARILKRLDDVSKRMLFVERLFKDLMTEGHRIEEATGEPPETVSIPFGRVYDVLDACMFIAVNKGAIQKAIAAQLIKECEASERNEKESVE